MDVINEKCARLGASDRAHANAAEVPEGWREVHRCQLTVAVALACWKRVVLNMRWHVVFHGIIPGVTSDFHGARRALTIATERSTASIKKESWVAIMVRPVGNLTRFEAILQWRCRSRLETSAVRQKGRDVRWRRWCERLDWLWSIHISTREQHVLVRSDAEWRLLGDVCRTVAAVGDCAITCGVLALVKSYTTAKVWQRVEVHCEIALLSTACNRASGRRT